MNPAVQATEDYMGGLGQEANPFSKNTQDWWTYALKMCEHQTRELQDLRHQNEGICDGLGKIV